VERTETNRLPETAIKYTSLKKGMLGDMKCDRNSNEIRPRPKHLGNSEEPDIFTGKQ
jgi:hypothetical protein